MKDANLEVNIVNGSKTVINDRSLYHHHYHQEAMRADATVGTTQAAVMATTAVNFLRLLLMTDAAMNLIVLRLRFCISRAQTFSLVTLARHAFVLQPSPSPNDQHPCSWSSRGNQAKVESTPTFKPLQDRIIPIV